MNHLPHDCRHTCATLLANADVDKKIIQLILGHRSQDITDRVYTHKTLSQLIDAVNRL
jgi:integrase